MLDRCPRSLDLALWFWIRSTSRSLCREGSAARCALFRSWCGSLLVFVDAAVVMGLSYSCIDRVFFSANLAVLCDGPSLQSSTGALFVAASLSIAFGLWFGLAARCLAARLLSVVVAAYVLRLGVSDLSLRLGPLVVSVDVFVLLLARFEWSPSLLRQGGAPAPHGRAFAAPIFLPR